MRLDRYGSDAGFFTTSEGTKFEMRSLAPGTDMKQYRVFEVIEPNHVRAGEIVPWFDEVGGGIQYLVPFSVDDLIRTGKLKGG